MTGAWILGGIGFGAAIPSAWLVIDVLRERRRLTQVDRVRAVMTSFDSRRDRSGSPAAGRAESQVRAS